MSVSSDLIVSIRPQHARNIVAGLKTVELRRRFPVNVVVGRIMFIYSSSPDQAIIGAVQIENVCRMPVKCLWREYRQRVCLSKISFFI